MGRGQGTVGFTAKPLIFVGHTIVLANDDAFRTGGTAWPRIKFPLCLGPWPKLRGGQGLTSQLVCREGRNNLVTDHVHG